MPKNSARATAGAFTSPTVDETKQKPKPGLAADPAEGLASRANAGLRGAGGGAAKSEPPAQKEVKAEPRRGIPIMFVRFTMQLEFGEWLEQIRPNRPIGYELELVGNLLHVRWTDRNTKTRELVLVPTSMIRSMRAFPEKPAKTE